MKDDLEQRLLRLEGRLGRLEGSLEAERAREKRKRLRERWLRLGVIVALGLAYAFYVSMITDVL